ncbi:MAG: glycosyltransferase family 4 protein [Lachnospiraceae bacterium]|nr:glycosyltransferase family 4 protein [Lachnospiraceae bacterium]
MKILMVNKFLYPNGGSETYIFELGKKLHEMGHEVQYFGMEHEGRIVGNHAESYTANMDFHSTKLQKILYPFKIIYSHEARKKIRPVLDDFAPDVVHLNNINFQITPSILYEIKAYEKQNKRSVRIVCTAHDYQWVCPNHMMMIPSDGTLCFACRGGRFGACTKNRCIHNSRIRSLLGSLEAFYYKNRRTYALVDTVICPSEFMKKQLDTSPVLAKKTLMLHNFVTPPDTEEETGAWETIKKRLPERYVLYFGRFSEEKGVRTLLKVCKNMTNVSFVFAGTGPLTEEVSRVSNIRNAGFVRGKALKELIAGAAFSLYPSEWYENCPFSVMESQMYGTPMIASSLGGIPELLSDGVTGELFEAGNAAQLQEKIARLWDHPEICQKYRENCKNIKFDTIEEYCGKIIKQAYQS